MVYSALKGRLGNNLFQIAAGLSLAKRNNTSFAAIAQKLILPAPDNGLSGNYLEQFRGNILRNINLVDKIPLLGRIYNEKDSTFSPIEYQPDIILDGYFQSEKYFDKGFIEETFSIDAQTLSYINNRYGNILSNETTSIHVRRGDYTTIPGYHPVCSISYFKNAINYIGKKKQFLIISDDIDWCKNNFKGYNYFFAEGENPVVDLYLQSLCANNIISNSSFSWWGAWLNANLDKIVIAPGENWVGKKHPVQNTQDILPQSWIKLPNPLNYSIRIKRLYDSILHFIP